ncbi:MAG: DUF3137 domain-containing protein [Bacillota bacterium]|nr:DUF3137 domain-containing protein [Bacillota bacterium]
MSILKKMFGPSQNEVWDRLCSDLGFELVKGGIWRGDKVVAKLKEWTITLDTYTVSNGKTSLTYTRIRAPYINKDGFRFKIYRKSIFSNLGKLLGMQDIEVGFPQFDENFIIKGNDANKLQQLFAEENIRKMIELQPKISFEVKDDEGWFGTEFPEGVDELYFQAPGVIKDVDRLKSLFYLFALVLNQLCEMDSAYEDDPETTLKR